MHYRSPVFAVFLLGALVLSAGTSPGQGNKKRAKEDKPAPSPEELIFKGTITSVEQEIVHTVTLKKDVSYTITLNSPGFIASTQVEDINGKKIVSFTGSSVLKAPEDGLYRLLVTSPGGSSGQYVASMRPTKLTPTTVGEVLTVGTEGLMVEAVLTKDDPLDKARKKYCRTYDVKMDAGKTYIIDLTSQQFDAYLRLEDAAGKQLAQDDDSGGGNNARIRFKAPSEGVYRVIATSFGLETGLFVLKMRLDADPMPKGKQP